MTTRNKTILLFTTVLLVLLLGISMTTAADTNTTQQTQAQTQIEHTTPQVTQDIQSTDNNKKIIKKKIQSNTTSKKVEKTNKNIKKSTIDKEVNNYEELKQAITEADNSTTDNEYHIKLNKGTYNCDETITWGTKNNSVKKIYINGNNQTIESTGNTAFIKVQNGYTLSLKNTILSNVYVDCVGGGNVEFEDINNPLEYRTFHHAYGSYLTLNNYKFTSYMDYNGNLKLNNCTLNNEININSPGILYISDDTKIGSSTLITGTVVTNQTNIIYHYKKYDGNYTIRNCVFNTGRSNVGNLTLINSRIDALFSNQGNLTLINSTVTSTINDFNGMTLINSNITSTGHIYHSSNLLIIDNNTKIDDDVIISIVGGSLVTNQTSILAKTDYFNGTYVLNNVTLKRSGRNYGNLTLINSKFDRINNYGDLTLINSTFNETANYESGSCNLTLINSTGEIRSSYDNIITIINSTINNDIDSEIGNNLTIINSVLNATIANGGTLIIDDNTVIGNNTFITENSGFIGDIITNKTDIVKYVENIEGVHTLENMTNFNSRNNYGNLTLINSKIDGINNYGNLTLINSTLNGTIYNNGTLSISDNTVFGDDILLNNVGTIVTNKTISFKYIGIFNGTYTIENMTNFNSRSNYGNLTLINSTVKDITNTGNLTLINSTISDFTNNGNLNLFNSNISGKNMNRNGNLTLINCSLSNNEIGQYLISNINSNLTVINSTIENNTNNTGLYSQRSIISNTQKSHVTIINSIFNNNNHLSCVSCSNGFASLNLINTTMSNNYKMTENGIRYLRSCVYVSDSSSSTQNNISIINSTFYNNYAGNVNLTNGYNGTYTLNSLGSDINILSAKRLNLYIHNTSFTGVNSSKSIVISSGNNTVIDNCTFTGINSRLDAVESVESVDGAAILLNNIQNVLINNTVFMNNSVYSISTWTLGLSGAAISVKSDVLNFTLTNSVFKNNKIESVMRASAADISIERKTWGSYGVVLLKNNTFINSSTSQGVGSISSSNGNVTLLNNTFINVNGEDTLNIKNNRGVLANNTYVNCSIAFSNFTLNNPGKVFVNDTVNITGVIVLKNPRSYDSDILNRSKYEFYTGSKLYKIENSLNTSITRNSTDNVLIYVKPSISRDTSRTLVLKLTQHPVITITPKNQDSYIANGELAGIDEDSIVYFKGNFSNLKTISITVPNIKIDGSNATFINTSFSIDEENVTIMNMHINNTDTSEYAIEVNTDNNIIANNTIYVCNKEGKTAAIAGTRHNNITVTGNNLIVYGPILSINYDSNNEGIVNTQGILLNNGENSSITYNNIKVYNSTDPEHDAYGTIEAITVPRGSNILIANNNLSATGARFVYAVNTVTYEYNITIQDNNINVTGYRYADGIQMGGAINSTIKGNNITGTCYNSTIFTNDNEPMIFGIIVTNMGTRQSVNVTVKDNILKINSSIVYGMEIYQTLNSTITNNTIIGNGNYTMGLSLAHSPNNKVENNTMNLRGNSNIPINYIVEEIRPANTGVQVQQDSDNSTIIGNNIKVYDIAGNDTAVNVDNRNITVTNNQLRTSKNTGDNAVKANGVDIKVTNNTQTKLDTTITVNPTNIALYENSNITAIITDEYGNKVKDGQVFFKINGKTLKDMNGNNIYIDVINGTAALDYYADSIKANTTTIVYTGNENYNTARANGTINVAKTNATMKIDILNKENLKPGKTAIIMVTVTDINGNMVKSGKVVFKLNGKTIKDENGNTITVRIHNGVAIFKYIVPANYSAKNYTLTAVSVGNTYNRIETTTNIRLTRINTYIEPTNIQFTNNTLHIKANIISTTTLENVAYRETKVTVKINNKTFVKEAKITNGTINLNIDTSSIGRGNYAITIKTGDNGIYTGTQMDTYVYKAPIKQTLKETSNNGTLVKA